LVTMSSPLGVSSTLMTSANRGSRMIRRNGSAPSDPSAISSCRSLRDANGVLESFRWKQRRCSRPIRRSHSSQTASWRAQVAPAEWGGRCRRSRRWRARRDEARAPPVPRTGSRGGPGARQWSREAPSPRRARESLRVTPRSSSPPRARRWLPGATTAGMPGWWHRVSSAANDAIERSVSAGSARPKIR
jgi:hypothetical protein